MVAGPNVSVFVTSIIFTTLSFVLVGLRLYTRIVVVQNVGIDDWLMPAALVSSIYQLSDGKGMRKLRSLTRRPQLAFVSL